MTDSIVTNACRYAGPDATRTLGLAGRVFCHDLSFVDAAVRVDFEAQYVGAIALAATEPEEAVAEALAQSSGMDVLFANHFQTPEGKALEETQVEDFRATLENLLVAPYRFIKAALPALKRAESGRIVLMTSAAPLRPGAKVSLYTAARAGENALVGSLARELGPAGIAVFGIAPNFFASDDTYSRAAFENSEKFRSMVQRAVPLQRLSNEQEMARLIHYLCLDDSAFVTGQVFAFTGGWA